MEISLALGGGGAKGVAHLGVLLWLEEHGFKIKAVAGTSAGGIVAALYAAGYSPGELIERFEKINQSTLFGRQPGDGPSILGVLGLNKILSELIGDSTFADLKIPCSLTAVDLLTEKEVVLHKGRVVDAVLSTIALPGVFPPHSWEGYLLVDGGLLNPVPVLPARALAPGLPVVAVVLSNAEPQLVSYLDPQTFFPGPPILRQVSRLRIAQAFSVFLHSIDISSRYLTTMRLKLDKPEVIIQPELNDIGILDKVDILELSKRGQAAAEAVRLELKQATSLPSRLQRLFKPGRL